MGWKGTRVSVSVSVSVSSRRQQRTSLTLPTLSGSTLVDRSILVALLLVIRQVTVKSLPNTASPGAVSTWIPTTTPTIGIRGSALVCSRPSEDGRRQGGPGYVGERRHGDGTGGAHWGAWRVRKKANVNTQHCCRTHLQPPELAEVGPPHNLELADRGCRHHLLGRAAIGSREAVQVLPDVLGVEVPHRVERGPWWAAVATVPAVFAVLGPDDVQIGSLEELVGEDVYLLDEHGRLRDILDLSLQDHVIFHVVSAWAWMRHHRMHHPVRAAAVTALSASKVRRL